MLVDSIEETTTGRVVHFDEPLTKRSKKAPPVETVDEAHLRETLCALAVERAENRALRKYVDWLTKRVQALESQLTDGT